jgi:hypothetical protein
MMSTSCRFLVVAGKRWVVRIEQVTCQEGGGIGCGRSMPG